MLNVKTPEEVFEIINNNFNKLNKKELVKIEDSLDRILAEDIISNEFVPNFNRSTVDGYAICAKDSFGCSENNPLILEICEYVEMGEEPKKALQNNTCSYVATGGAIPLNADAVVMVEYSEKYSDNEVAILKPCSPGENIIFKGDDTKPNDIIKTKGQIIKPQDIGTFASLGIKEVYVVSRPIVGIISTGDELVSIDKTPSKGQIRDVNTYLLTSLFKKWGCTVNAFGFFKDDKSILRSTIKEAIDKCDFIVISGGSSVGQKDTTASLIEEYSPLLSHGIAIKPGKPTILGKINNKPILGLPGHPGAAFIVASIFAKALFNKLTGCIDKKYYIEAKLTENISSNQGRAVCIGVIIKELNKEYFAEPLASKSGLIKNLTLSDGFIITARNQEGLAKDSKVKVYLF